MKKTVYVGFKFLHMGDHSGYDLVKFYADYDIILDCQKDFNWLHRFLRSGSLLSRIYGRFKIHRLWWIEWRCLILALRHRNLVFHFIYAENVYRYLGWFKWLGFKVVCTYHQPPSFFLKRPEFIKGMRQVDEIIVLSNDIVDFFKQITKLDNVHFIPHGVDIDFFCPDDSVTVQRKVLMVGNWLRNFRFADLIFRRLLEEDSELKVHVVANEENLKNFNSHDRLHLHHNISDEELLQHYRSSALLFLPLNGFVANNAVIEMCSVGRPILIAAEQQESLFPPNVVELTTLDAENVIKIVLERLDNPDQYNDTRRDWVVHQFEWREIGKKTRRVLMQFPGSR